MLTPRLSTFRHSNAVNDIRRDKPRTCPFQAKLTVVLYSFTPRACGPETPEKGKRSTAQVQLHVAVMFSCNKEQPKHLLVLLSPHEYLRTLDPHPPLSQPHPQFVFSLEPDPTQERSVSLLPYPPFTIKFFRSISRSLHMLQVHTSKEQRGKTQHLQYRAGKKTRENAAISERLSRKTNIAGLGYIGR